MAVDAARGAALRAARDGVAIVAETQLPFIRMLAA